MKLGLKKLSVLFAVLLLILAVMTGCSELTHRDSDIEAPKTTTDVEVIEFVELDDRTFGVRMTESAKMSGDVTEITIPNNYFGVPVTHIFEDGFNGASTVEIISVPSSIKTVGKNAFAGCSMLRSVSLSSAVSIGENAFNGCTQLSTVTLGNGLTSLEAGVFKGCKNLSSLTIPDTVVTIAADALSGCEKLASLTVGEGIVALDATVLADCKGLETITLGKNVADLDMALFAGCTGLKTITVHTDNADYMTLDGILYNKQGTQILYAPMNVSGAVTISKGVVNIGASTFAGRKSLETLTIPDGVKTIDETAFLRCTGLKTITIGNGVAHIDKAMFADCTGLEAVIVNGTNENYITKDGIVYEKESRKILFIPANLTGDIELLEGVKSIDAFAFADRKALTSVTLAKSVERIGESAFSGCDAMKSFTIEEGVKFIDVSAFAGCDVLKTVVIGSDVDTIAEPVYLAFEECAALESVVVSEYNKSYLSKDGILYDKPVTQILFVPAAIAGEITLADGVLGIEDLTFENRAALTAVTIPGSVAYIGESAFAGCAEGLIQIVDGVSYVGKWVVACDATATEVTLREDTVGIAKSAFAGCEALKKLTIGEKLAYIAEGELDACTALESIVVSDKNLNFVSKNGVLYNKPVTDILCIPAKLAGDVVIPEGVTAIAANAFAGRTAIKSIQLPTTLESIGFGAFDGCADTLFTAKDGVIYIGAWAIGFDTTLPETLTFLDGTVGIADGAFVADGTVKKVVIGKSIAYVGDSAFDGCAALELIEVATANSNYVAINGILYDDPTTAILCVPAKLAGDVVIPEGVIAIDANAFADRTGVESIVLPSTIESIGADAFAGCSEDLTVVENGLIYLGNWVIGCEAETTAIVLKTDTVGIADSAFAGCDAVTTIVIGADVAYIGANVFDDCVALTFVNVNVGNANYVSLDGILYDKNEKTILCIPAELSSTDVEILDGVTAIDAYAFAGLLNLETVKIPASVAEIGENAFAGCDFLTAITVDIANEAYASVGGILYNKAFTEILYVPTMIEDVVVIVDGVAEITADTFAGCTEITVVYIPASVTEIDKTAFDTCENLVAIVVAEENTMYCSQDGILYNKPVTKIIAVPTALEGEVTIMDGVNGIASGMFADRDMLMEINIPASVTSIAKDAFDTCWNLLYIQVDENNAEYCSADGILYNKEGTDIICVPANVSGDITILEGVTSIDNYEFTDRVGLTSVVLPEGVTSIGVSAFMGCYQLETITLPESLETISTAAFYRCMFLNHVVIPDGITRIEADTFGECIMLTDIVIGENVESIGTYAFAGCILLQKITIPEKVESIDRWAFSLCYNLGEVVFENTEGWVVDGEVIDVTDPVQAATNLLVTYGGFEWTC